MGSEVKYDNRLARQLRKLGDGFSTDPKFTGALNSLSLDPKRRLAAIKDPEGFLSEAGLKLPEGLGFDLFDHPPRFMPFPDWFPWLIELTSCRTVYVRECDDTPGIGGLRNCKFEERQLCLGFRIYPRPWPRGPFSL
jgi:hypothetical protein